MKKWNDWVSREEFPHLFAPSLASVVISFRDSKTERFTVTHLVQKAVIDPKKDTVELVGDPQCGSFTGMIIKPYLVCRCFRFSLKEAAQSLYIYFEAMPAGTLFVSMKRLRERLLLTTPVRTQNQIIRKAMLELKSIGYLEYQEVKKGRDIQFQIFKRSPKLALAKHSWCSGYSTHKSYFGCNEEYGHSSKCFLMFLRIWTPFPVSKLPIISDTRVLLVFVRMLFRKNHAC